MVVHRNKWGHGGGEVVSSSDNIAPRLPQAVAAAAAAARPKRAVRNRQGRVGKGRQPPGGAWPRNPTHSDTNTPSPLITGLRIRPRVLCLVVSVGRTGMRK
eukprot:SAG22_NODE_119_length_19257_cov_43.260413_22_plen_101_part_00